MNTYYRRGLFRQTTYVSGRVVLWILSLLAFAPIVMLVLLSFRPTTSIESDPIALPTSLFTGNYSAAWREGSLESAFVSSIVCTAVAICFLVTAGQLLAYVLVRRGTRSASAVLVYVLIGLMIPFPTRILPLFTAMSRLHLTGSMLSVIIFQCGSLMPLTVLLYSGFLRRLPTEYEEAALVDGAGPLRTVWSVVMPLLRPCSGAVATLAGIIIWNDFFTPLMLVGGSRSATLPVAIYSFVGEYTAQWGQIFAGIAMASLPVIVGFIVFQKYLVQGLGSGLKG